MSRLSRRLTISIRLLLIVKVNDVLNLVSVVDDSHVSADSHVPVIAPRRRKLAGKVSGHGMLFSPQIWIKHSSLAKPRFLVRRQSVCLSESSGRVLLVLAIPVSRDLAVVVVELGMTVPIMLATLVVPILSRDSSTPDSQEYYRNASRHQSVPIHVSPPCCDAVVKLGAPRCWITHHRSIRQIR
jgi:hypothetical protein